MSEHFSPAKISSAASEIPGAKCMSGDPALAVSGPGYTDTFSFAISLFHLLLTRKQ